MKPSIRPLTPDLWPALEELFAPRGACNGCWCAYWRIGSAYKKNTPAQNKRILQKVVMTGPPPGLIAFAGRVPVAWCQLTPRADLPWLNRTWRLKPVDDLPVWSISCLYVRKGYRRRGINEILIRAAIRAAKGAGAPAIEAYPLDARFTPSASGTGFASTFARIGFKKVAGRTAARPIMRLNLRARA
jgi:GNAT superfamily N-acetyltransferase